MDWRLVKEKRSTRGVKGRSGRQLGGVLYIEEVTKQKKRTLSISLKSQEETSGANIEKKKARRRVKKKITKYPCGDHEQKKNTREGIQQVVILIWK